MKSIKIKAIFIIWLREMRRIWRFKSELIGSLMMPLMFLVFLGFGLNDAALPGIPKNVTYINFIMAGVIGMTLLFNSMFGGMDVLWDKEMGFLKEVMVSPVSRLSIFIGRVAASSTTSIIESIIILLLGIPMGFRFPSFGRFIIVFLFMVITSFTFIGLGLAISSRMRNTQGFPIIMNFVIFPLFFLSGAFYPVEALPKILKPLCYIDPLTYGVDGMRWALIGVSSLPILFNFSVLSLFCIAIIFIGVYLFETAGDIGN
jgi:ABC-2 type transport system permease protein